MADRKAKKAVYRVAVGTADIKEKPAQGKVRINKKNRQGQGNRGGRKATISQLPARRSIKKASRSAGL